MQWVLSFVCLATLAAGVRLSAQAVTGTILGTVTDASGARVPGATLKAINSLTGVSHSTSSDAQGDYIFPALAVGQYRIEANVTGFRRFVREGVGLSVNQNARVDIVLQVGQVTQSVVVKQNAPLVDTRDVQIGGLVDRQRVQDLPLNGRNVYSLVTLLPGVTSVSLPDQPGPLGGTTMNGVNNDRPNFVGNPYLSTSRPQSQLLAEYFNPAAFEDAAAGMDGTAGRNILFGPSSDNWSVSFFKTFPIHESHQLQFRAEFFNFFNTPNFNNPTANLNSGNVGKILGAGAGRVIQFALRYSF